MSYVRIIVFALWAMAAPASAATPFHTALLERMAKAIGFQAPTPLPAHADMDSVAIVRSRAVHLRTNAWGDVAHIGYNLFNRAFTEQYHNDLLFEFVERYLLELDLGLDERGTDRRMQVDQVTLVKGSLDLLRQVTPQTDLSFSVEEIKRKLYRLTWQLNGQEVCLTIPADCQLIIGANAIELEEMALRDIPRMVSLAGGDIIQDWSASAVTRSDNLLIVDGGIYMSTKIRGDLYLTEQQGVRRLLCSPDSPSRSVRNIMLTGIFEKELPADLVLNKYGLQRDSLNVTLQQFVAYCKQEHCKLYFGIKQRTGEVLEGTLFAYNENLAYVHMLSVVFPLSLLRGGDEPLHGTAYVYIPIGHIADSYFNQEFYPTLYD